MKIEVFKSPYTGELFEDEALFLSHIQHQERAKEIDVEQVKKSIEREEALNNARLTATSIEDFRDKVFEWLEREYGSALLDFENIRFGEINDSHSAPIGKPTNWREPNKHLGWWGRVYIFDTFRFPGINFGSGGSRKYKDYKNALEYELRLYLEDFPLIKEQYNRFQELKKIKGEWADKINDLIKQRCFESSTIKANEKLLQEFNEGIVRLKERCDKVYKEMKEEEEMIETSVRASNPFTLADELNNVSKLFNK